MGSENTYYIVPYKKCVGKILIDDYTYKCDKYSAFLEVKAVGSLLRKYMEKKNITLFEQNRVNLDSYFFEPFQEISESYDTSKVYETEGSPNKKKLKLLTHPLTNFAYFMDGSRKVYKIGDIITPENRFMPIVAGQVSAGCCLRDEQGDMHKHILEKQNYLMLSDAINSEDFEYIKRGYEREMKSKIDISVNKYRFDKMKEDKPVNAAVAVVQGYMHDLEIGILERMVASNVLSPERMLILDGALQFLPSKIKNPDIFYNVIGVSKSFNPNLTKLTKHKTHIGTQLSKLEFAERTPVMKMKSSDEKFTYGVWYVRIRDTQKRGDPLDGVVKIEKMALKEELDNDGFDSGLIDTISMSLIEERIPTCYGNDDRWANHLYPIYLTEKMVKSSFLSDTYFSNLF